MLVENALKEIEARKQMVSAWWSDEAVALSLKAKFSQLVFGAYNPSIHWEYPYWKGIFITIYKVNGMHDLKPVFQFLGRHGYTHSGNPEIAEELRRVTWTFGNIKLLVFFSEKEDSTCRFVKIGTKNVDDIKLICPEMQT